MPKIKRKKSTTEAVHSEEMAPPPSASTSLSQKSHLTSQTCDTAHKRFRCRLASPPSEGLSCCNLWLGRSKLRRSHHAAAARPCRAPIMRQVINEPWGWHTKEADIKSPQSCLCVPPHKTILTVDPCDNVGESADLFPVHL